MNWLLRLFTLRSNIFVKPKRKVNRLFIHCSASDNPEHDDVSVIRRWHLARGWDDCGYHVFIKHCGTVQFGRDIEVIPAAQSPNNAGTIAICLHGLSKDKFTLRQKRALISLCKEINESYDSVTFHGHKEVASHKTCPVLDYVSVLGLDPFGNMRR